MECSNFIFLTLDIIMAIETQMNNVAVHYVGFQVLTEVSMKMAVFWVLAPRVW
jgi:hypothetical protein